MKIYCIYTIIEVLLLLAHLKDEELEIVALIRRPQNRMIRCLLPEFHLTKTLVHAFCSLTDYLREQFLCHEMGAAAGCKIPAVLHKLQAFPVDLTVAFDCILGCFA